METQKRSLTKFSAHCGPNHVRQTQQRLPFCCCVAAANNTATATLPLSFTNVEKLPIEYEQSIKIAYIHLLCVLNKTQCWVGRCFHSVFLSVRQKTKFRYSDLSLSHRQTICCCCCRWCWQSQSLFAALL